MDEVFKRLNHIELALNDRLHGERSLKIEVDRNTKITEGLVTKIDENHAALIARLDQLSAGKIVSKFLSWAAPILVGLAAFWDHIWRPLK